MTQPVPALQEVAVGTSPPPARLPSPRGPLTEQLFEVLRRPMGRCPQPLSADLIGYEDLHLALYCCYELHYSGWRDVDADWEWDPSLLALRSGLERRFERELRAMPQAAPTDPDSVVAELWRMADPDGGPSLSRWLSRHGTVWHIRELAKHRSAYQLKEADPHTWAIPRLQGRAKAAMACIQYDEYGSGRAESMHSSLFADTMRALELQATPNAYLDEIPGSTLAPTNAISLFGLHRRLRGALVGHLALFEMTSTVPMRRYADLLARLGLPPAARAFYEVHVEADELHQHIGAGMVRDLVHSDPDLAGDVLLGARALTALEAHASEAMLGRWESGQSSLRAVH